MDLPRVRRRILRFLLLFAVGYLLALLFLRIFERRFVFFPEAPGRLEGDWSPRGLSNEDVWFQSSDGTRLNAWWIPADGAKVTFLAFHGNAGNIADRAEVYRFLKQVPVNVLAVEYRGYGKSGGEPSESSLYQDAEAAFDYLTTSKAIPSEKIVAYGQSLGTTVAAHLAARRRVGAVVLEAPFTSAAAVAQRKLWFFPGLSLLLWGQFDTEKALINAQEPILVVHCVDDPVIPYELGKALYEGLRGPKYFLSINGQCHEEASIYAAKRYRQQLQDFLSTVNASGASHQE